jgi:ectoine hydroxylase
VLRELGADRGGDGARWGASEPERRAYRERGFFVRRALFAEPELTALRAAVERIHLRMLDAAQGLPAGDAGEASARRIDGRRYESLHGSLVKWEWDESLRAIRSMEPVEHLAPELAALTADARLCEAAAALLGTDGVSLFTDKLNFKRPGGSPFPWHQDAPYWAFSCAHLERLTSVQLYLDDATEQNGCLWVVPESHRSGHLPAPRRPGVLTRLYTDLEQIPGAAAPLPLDGPAGSAIFFDPYLVHGSRGNRSRDSRRALVLTYQPPDLPRFRV